MAKWRSRSADLARRGVPTQALQVIHTYAQVATRVLLFVGSMFVMPTRLSVVEAVISF